MLTRAARLSALLLLWPALALGQSPKMAATYITDEEVKAVNKLPGVDRQIISTDIGKSNLSVGIVHRGATNAPAATPPGGGGAGSNQPAASRAARRRRPGRRPESRTMRRPRPTSSCREAARSSPAAASSTAADRRPTAR